MVRGWTATTSSTGWRGGSDGPKTGGGTWGAGASIIGPQGQQGTTGTSGTPGTPGRTVLNGSAVPDPGLGIDGDFYLRTTTSTFYGPKTAGAWGTGISLVGPQGEQGEQGPPGLDGRTWFSGSGAPGAGVGQNGDFYINLTAGAFYGPKSAGAWGSATSIIGPQGTQGSPGNPGAAGLSVLSGSGAPGAGLGVEGEWYIRTGSWTIQQKVGGVWGAAASLVGPPGEQGIQGTPGNQGIQGIPGQDGRTWHSGAGAPSGALGANGDFYFNTTGFGYHGPKAGGAWPALVSIPGPPGHGWRRRGRWGRRC